MSKNKKKATKRRLIVFGGISFVAIIYFILSLITYTLDIKSLKKQELELTNKLTSLKENAEELKIKIEKLKDPEYIARFAREEFSYSKEKGEYIIKIEKKQDNEVKVETQENNTYKYIVTAIGIILLFIILYVLKKR